MYVYGGEEGGYAHTFKSLSLSSSFLFVNCHHLENPGFILIYLIPIQHSRLHSYLSSFHICNCLCWEWETLHLLFSIYFFSRWRLLYIICLLWPLIAVVAMFLVNPIGILLYIVLFNRLIFFRIVLDWQKVGNIVQRVPNTLHPHSPFINRLVWNIRYNEWTIIDTFLVIKVHSLFRFL